MIFKKNRFNIIGNSILFFTIFGTINYIESDLFLLSFIISGLIVYIFDRIQPSIKLIRFDDDILFIQKDYFILKSYSIPYKNITKVSYQENTDLINIQYLSGIVGKILTLQMASSFNQHLLVTKEIFKNLHKREIDLFNGIDKIEESDFDTIFYELITYRNITKLFERT